MLRRTFLAGLILAPLPVAAQDYIDFLFSPVGRAPQADRSTRGRVALRTNEPVGTILIDVQARRLFLIEGEGFAQSYQVGVGREGFGWFGTETISAKREWPDWRPPAEMRARRPDLPAFVAGGPDNPMGARALYLGAASSGCFRMTNTDVIDLYGRVRIGARVRVF